MAKQYPGTAITASLIDQGISFFVSDLARSARERHADFVHPPLDVLLLHRSRSAVNTVCRVPAAFVHARLPPARCNVHDSLGYRWRSQPLH
jgi:hypothetical protein